MGINGKDVENMVKAILDYLRPKHFLKSGPSVVEIYREIQSNVIRVLEKEKRSEMFASFEALMNRAWNKTSNIFVLQNSNRTYDIFYVVGSVKIPTTLLTENVLIEALSIGKQEAYVLEDVPLELACEFIKGVYLYDRVICEKDDGRATNGLRNKKNHDFASIRGIGRGIYYDGEITNAVVYESEVVPVNLHYLDDINIENMNRFDEVMRVIKNNKYLGTNIYRLNR